MEVGEKTERRKTQGGGELEKDELVGVIGKGLTSMKLKKEKKKKKNKGISLGYGRGSNCLTSLKHIIKTGVKNMKAEK